MKRTRTQTQEEAEPQAGNLATANTTGNAIAALPLPDPAAVFSTEVEAFANAITSRVPPNIVTTRYVSTAFNIPPAPDQLETVRKMIYEGIRGTNMAAGWVARWPGPTASIDILARFSGDLCNFFYVDVNATIVIPDLTRRTTFLSIIHSLRIFFDSHKPTIEEFTFSDRAVGKFRRNRIIELGDHRLVVRGEFPPFPDNWARDVHAYCAQLEAALLRWHAAIEKTGKIVQELITILDKLRVLLLAEVPAQIRELVWPGE
jgi:hypothetical protein